MSKRKTLDIYTNLVYGGWNPKDLETGIGGSEEKLIEFSQGMVERGWKVRVFMNGYHGKVDGVEYIGHKVFEPMEHRDVFISFKSPQILINTINADKKFHLTTEIEGEWPKFLLDSIDGLYGISKYHASRIPYSSKLGYKYLWFDKERMDKIRPFVTFNHETIENMPEEKKSWTSDLHAKEEGSVLYCSSFDRGLEELLANWDLMKEKLGVKKLYITYGWDFMVNLIKNRPELVHWKRHIEGLMGYQNVTTKCEHCGHEVTEWKQTRDDIVFVGRLSNDEMCKMYWKCQFWALPLSNPDSELFCINAVKAQYAGCIPIVRKVGALQETVNKCINWEEILGRPNQKSSIQAGDDYGKIILENREFAEKFGMKEALDEWNTLFGKTKTEEK